MATAKGPTLQCAKCGGDFRVPPVRAATAKYCSARCKYDDREAATRITKVCRFCGNEFQTWKAHDNDFCSYDCTWQSRIRKVKRLCAYCGEPFEVKRSEDDVCCSWECRVARSKTEVWPTRTKQLRQCDECGKEFWRKPSQILRRGGKFCTHRCYGLAKRSEFPPPAPGFYNSTYWHEIRATVLERDGSACKKCGFRGRGLHIHHIMEKRNGGGEELDNLVTLCSPCHRRTHRQV